MIVRITDEFNTTWSVTCESTQSVIDIVKHWLENRDSTPLYEIVIEVDNYSQELA